jgi:hypothetical protein
VNISFKVSASAYAGKFSMPIHVADCGCFIFNIKLSDEHYVKLMQICVYDFDQLFTGRHKTLKHFSALLDFSVVMR